MSSDGKVMTKELSRALAADAVRRLCREEELHLQPERFSRMRGFSSGTMQTGDRMAGYQHPQNTILPTAAPTLGQRTRHLLLQSCALHRFRLHLGDVTSASLQTSSSEEHKHVGECDSARGAERHIRWILAGFFSV